MPHLLMDHNLLASNFSRVPTPILAFTGTSSLWTLPLVHWCSLHSKGSHFKLCLSQSMRTILKFYAEFYNSERASSGLLLFHLQKVLVFKFLLQEWQRGLCKAPKKPVDWSELNFICTGLSGSEWQESCPRWKATCYHA